MHDILIAGGGYAGLWAAVAAARQAEAAGRSLDIALVSREPWLTARPRLYERDLTRAEAQHALAPVLEAVGARLIEGEVTAIDREGRSLSLADGRRLAGRALVLALGSRARPAPFAGHVHGVDTWAEAEAFWAAVRAEAGGEAAIAVIGAGFTGIELALELAGWREAEAPRARILLIDQARPAAGYEGPARAVILEALARWRVDVLQGRRLRSVEDGVLILEDGERIAAGLAVWTGGLEAAAPLAGRLPVDRRLRLQEGVFAAGDAARAPLADGNATVFSCQHALSTGLFAGDNAARALLGQPLVDYAPRPYVTCLDLGPAGALLTSGFERALQMQGAEAKQRKLFINRQLIVPPRDRAGLFAFAAASLGEAGPG